MPAKKGSRHLTATELSETAEWILARSEVPSWPEIAAHVARKHGVDRSTEALRRREELKSARDARKRAVAASPRKRGRPTTRQIKSRDAEIAVLKAEIAQLTAERDAAIDRNFKLLNAMRVRNIPEQRMERPLSPLNRDSTR